MKAIQDLYPENLSHCFGCGKDNPDGYQLKTYFKDSETYSEYLPSRQYTAIPGSVYGGLLASLLDCHGTASAAVFIAQNEGLEIDAAPFPVRCVTASLQVEYKAPTPMGKLLRIYGRLKEVQGRKAWVSMELKADDQVCVTAEILAIRLRDE